MNWSLKYRRWLFSPALEELRLTLPRQQAELIAIRAKLDRLAALQGMPAAKDAQTIVPIRGPRDFTRDDRQEP